MIQRHSSCNYDVPYKHLAIRVNNLELQQRRSHLGCLSLHELEYEATEEAMGLADSFYCIGQGF